MLMLTFFAGMLTVPLVIPFQKALQVHGDMTSTFLVWAAIEEFFKFGAAYLVAIRLKEDNEPVDALIYMMTVALGFAAMENSIFILGPISEGIFSQGLITGNVRFIGASLLHTLASATIGIALGLSFYKAKSTKVISTLLALVIATILHTMFNLLIMREHSGTTFATFGFVWISIVVLMLFFERIKNIYAVNKL
jgi:RsiW-degrading membrane proteinase PrsW (M82 family)